MKIAPGILFVPISILMGRLIALNINRRLTRKRGSARERYRLCLYALKDYARVAPTKEKD